MEKGFVLTELAKLEKGPATSKEVSESVVKALPEIKAACKEVNDVLQKINWAIANIESFRGRKEEEKYTGAIVGILTVLIENPEKISKEFLDFFDKILPDY